MSGSEELKQLKEELEAERAGRAKAERDHERVKKELQEFAYVASHDLQEPLRMVASYLGLIERRYKEMLDEDGLTFINFAVDGAKRMQGLIQGLLAYSRIGTRGGELGPLDSGVVLADILEGLSILIEESGAVVTHDRDLPVVMADEVQLGQLFKHLIDNALKFSKDTPKIHISSKKDGEETVFSVKDEGIGIEDVGHERVFSIFQRMVARDDYPGAGVGLALCKKIINRHDGRIWIESELEKGATVHFTLKNPTPEDLERAANQSGDE